MGGGENGTNHGSIGAERAGYIVEELPTGAILFEEHEHNDNEFNIYFGKNGENHHTWLASITLLSDGNYRCEIQGLYDTTATQNLIIEQIRQHSGNEVVDVQFIPADKTE